MRRAAGLLGCLVGLCVLWPNAASSQTRWALEFENGPAFTSYNDVRIPGDGGTLFSLTDQLTTDTAYYWRVKIDYRMARKHVLSMLAAPLRLNAAGALDTPLVFNTEVFPAGTQLTAAYQFNSYRLTYRYEFLQRETWMFGVGVTAKVRDAHTRVEGGGPSSTKANVGVVPLVNFKLRRTLTDRFAFVLEGDALAAPQGRAEDVLAALEMALGRNASFHVGYRLLEGGADVTEVYAFTLVNYLAIGATVRF